ncbi:hypothetical protein [Myxococcus sp. RHSTA-1-4]|uniref:hypothetical protein n=1 Tax=Myxococcus sp. RHSTA-1-4 TaxID=2874601 RepID=UPI001CBC1E46|nr:hypothetical protein [Myxococcus sp. RHSTA-1-4]MBZ4417426.1 hypothetical protein [Myxococcus sp. RHSTA-1-4]
MAGRPGMERAAEGLHGLYRDVVRDARGQVSWDSGWRSNAIVGSCRSLLAAFLRGGPPEALGIQGLAVGAGLEAWDSGFIPPATSAQTALVDPHPHLVPRSALTLSFLSGASVSPTPTNRLQISASLGPGVPPWPDTATGHPTSALREFGLVGRLDGQSILINYVTHPVITKDAASTLERTVWLVF